MAPEIAARITVDENGCWIVSGYGSNGYAQARRDGRTETAHRIVYRLLVGPIPEGMHVDHLCRVRRCSNPAHLEAVTPRENVLRGQGITALHARKTHCDNGHALTPDNIVKRARGGRECRTCHNANWHRWNERRAA